MSNFIAFDLGETKPDPAVNSLVQQGRQRNEERRLTKGERRKKIKEREKSEARKGRRALYDLSPELIEGMRTLAAEHSTTASQLAALAIKRFLSDVNTCEIDLRNYYLLSDGPRYERKIALDRQG